MWNGLAGERLWYYSMNCWRDTCEDEAGDYVTFQEEHKKSCKSRCIDKDDDGKKADIHYGQLHRGLQ